MSDESRKHDHWAEHLPDEELDLLLQKRQAEALLKEHELALAQFRVDRLEKEVARRRGYVLPKGRGPWLPQPALPWQPLFPEAVKPECGKCGLKLDSVMGYVCSQPMCPTGLGGPTC